MTQTSVCHGTQECGSLLVACSSFSVCCVSCSAAVLFSAVLPHLLQSEHLDLSLCRPPTSPPQHLSPERPSSSSLRPAPSPAQLSTHISSQTSMIVHSKQGRLDVFFCTEGVVFLFSLPLRVCDLTLSLSRLYFVLSILHPPQH